MRLAFAASCLAAAMILLNAGLTMTIVFLAKDTATGEDVIAPLQSPAPILAAPAPLDPHTPSPRPSPDPLHLPQPSPSP